MKHTSNGMDSIKRWENSLYTNEAGYVHEQAVRDSNVITANGTGTLEFAQESQKHHILPTNLP